MYHKERLTTEQKKNIKSIIATVKHLLLLVKSNRMDLNQVKDIINHKIGYYKLENFSTMDRYYDAVFFFDSGGYQESINLITHNNTSHDFNIPKRVEAVIIPKIIDELVQGEKFDFKVKNG